MDTRSWIRTPLGIVAVIFGIVMLVTAIALPVNQVTQPTGTVRVAISSTAAERALADIPNLPEGVSLSYPQDEEPLEVDLTALIASDGSDAVPAYYRAMSEAGKSVLALMMAVIVFLLLRLRTEFAAGRPFAARNARRLSAMALAVVVGAYGSAWLDSYAAQIFYDYLSLERPLYVSFEWSPVPLILAGALLIVAQAFKKGRALTEDVEGLV